MPLLHCNKRSVSENEALSNPALAESGERSEGKRGVSHIIGRYRLVSVHWSPTQSHLHLLLELHCQDWTVSVRDRQFSDRVCLWWSNPVVVGRPARIHQQNFHRLRSGEEWMTRAKHHQRPSRVHRPKSYYHARNHYTGFPRYSWMGDAIVHRSPKRINEIKPLGSLHQNHKLPICFQMDLGAEQCDSHFDMFFDSFSNNTLSHWDMAFSNPSFHVSFRNRIIR
jgi:hypothetical protein